MNQSYKPDKIILWLGKEKFKDISLPNSIVNLQSRGLEVRYCEDLICHTKYYYAIKEYSNSNVITIDDDIIYPKNMIKNLLNYKIKYPNCIICNRAHGIRFDENNKIKPYKEWDWEANETANGPSHYLFQTGVSGVLYPPNSLSKEVLNRKKFMKLCPKYEFINLCFMIKNYYSIK